MPYCDAMMFTATNKSYYVQHNLPRNHTVVDGVLLATPIANVRYVLYSHLRRQRRFHKILFLQNPDYCVPRVATVYDFSVAVASTNILYGSRYTVAIISYSTAVQYTVLRECV